MQEHGRRGLVDQSQAQLRHVGIRFGLSAHNHLSCSMLVAKKLRLSLLLGQVCLQGQRSLQPTSLDPTPRLAGILVLLPLHAGLSNPDQSPLAKHPS